MRRRSGEIPRMTATEMQPHEFSRRSAFVFLRVRSLP
jgi:hypothetical protein